MHCTTLLVHFDLQLFQMQTGRVAHLIGYLLLDYVFLWGNNPIEWSSKKQPTITQSSTEAEYHSLAPTAAEICWLTMLLKELHIPLQTVPVILCDNLSAISLAYNKIFHSRTKHKARLLLYKGEDVTKSYLSWTYIN